VTYVGLTPDAKDDKGAHCRAMHPQAVEE
jgi:hypothetical protein